MSNDVAQETVIQDSETLLQRYPRLEKQLDKQDRREIAKIIHEKVIE